MLPILPESIYPLSNQTIFHTHCYLRFSNSSKNCIYKHCFTLAWSL